MPGVQVVRVESYVKAAMPGVGQEHLRSEGSRCRNADIDNSLTGLNVQLKRPHGGSIGAAWHHAMDDIGPRHKVRRDAAVMDQMVVTSGPEFFEALGWRRGCGMTPEMDRFFGDAYAWAVSQVGFQGTDRNVLAATVHLDETTPHMHVAYIPIAESARKRVYAKDKNGKVLRNDKGSPIAERDENGRAVYRVVHEPRLSHTEFWNWYGGAESEVMTGRRNISYSLLQDSFHEHVGRKWGLDRGEVGSDARHESHHKKRMKKAKARLEAVGAEIDAARAELEDMDAEIDAARAELEDTDAEIGAARAELEDTDAEIDAAAAELEGMDAEIDAAKAELEAVRREAGDVEEARARNVEAADAVRREREDLAGTRADWDRAVGERAAEEARLDSAVRDKRSQLEALELTLGDVATAADLRTGLPDGRRGMLGRVSYSEEENDRLLRLARTGLGSRRIAQLYSVGVEERAELSADVARLSAQVDAMGREMERLRPKARQADQLAFELRRKEEEAAYERRRADGLARVLESLKEVVVRLLGAFGSKVRGAVEFVRSRLWSCGLSDVAEEVVADPAEAEALDRFVIENDRDREEESMRVGRGGGRRDWDMER